VENTEPQSVVRYGSGVQWMEIYSEAFTHSKIVTGGTSGVCIESSLVKHTSLLTLHQSVGAGGGWLMGGGHGFFTNRFGLGVDNVLEVEVVLPTGDIVIANAYSYPDLFWAIRGGGGGTFGVLTQITMKAHPSESLNAIRLGVYSADSGKEGFVKGMAYLMSVMPEWTDFGLTGHPILQKYRYNSLFTAPGKEPDAITTFVSPYVERLKTMGMNITIQNITSIVNGFTISQNFALNAGIENNYEGGPGVMGSRLWGREGLRDIKALENSMRLLMDKGYILEPFNIGGGAVSKNRNLNVSINPMWRDAVVHMSILPPNQHNITLVREVERAYKETTKDTLDLLDQFSVGSAVYLNEVSLAD
jgi:FAD binding domain